MKIDGVKFDNVTISAMPHGESVYTTPGTYSWTAPPGVTSVSVVCVGAGGAGASNGGNGGGAGALGYKNNIAVSPGSSYTVVVGQGGTYISGGDSYFISAVTVLGGGGAAGDAVGGSIGGSFVGDSGGQGGSGGAGLYTYVGGGGGGAGGFGGIGGGGGYGGYAGQAQAIGTNGSPGTGGGGGGGAGQNQLNNLSPPTGGGGVGIWGGTRDGAAGNIGSAAATEPATPGRGGSGGTDGRAGAIFGKGYWGTSTGTISGTTLTFGPTEHVFGDTIAIFGTNFLGMRVLYGLSTQIDLYIVENISGTGVNSQWRLNKVPSPLPDGTEVILVIDGPDGGSPGGGGAGGDGAGSFPGRGGHGAVRIIWPGATRSFPTTKTGRVIDYGFDIVQPQAWRIDATTPASYTSGGPLVDISGRGLANGTTATSTSLVGAGISFPGTGVGFNHGDILGTIANSAWSFGFWVKFNNVTTAQTVMGKTSSNLTGWRVGISSTGYLNMSIAAQQYNYSVAAELFTAGTWTHVIVTVGSGGTVTGYVNGAESSINVFSAPVTSDSGSFYVGSTASSGFLNGYLGEAYFYRKELTADEVLQNYNNTKWKYGL